MAHAQSGPDPIQLISLDSNNQQANGSSGNNWGVQMTPDARFVVFDSDATNLVANDSNGGTDVFLRDTQTQITSRISVGNSGQQATGSSWEPSIAHDGTVVAFASAASLVPADTNSYHDVYLRDLIAGTTTLVSKSGAGIVGNGHSSESFVSGDGRYVVFASAADQLVTGDTNSAHDIFLYDRQSGSIERVSLSSTGAQLSSGALFPYVSTTGRYVSFATAAAAVVGTPGGWNVYLRDRQSATTTKVSVSSSGDAGNGASGDRNSYPSVSSDGRYVTFESAASNLVAGDTNGTCDTFRRDLVENTTVRVSVSSGGAEGAGSSCDWGGPEMSEPGRFVVFSSGAANLVPGDTNGARDVFVRDVANGTTTLLPLNAAGAQANGESSKPAVSDSGRFVAFKSGSTNLLSPDANAWAADVLLYDRDAAKALMPKGQTFGCLCAGEHAVNPTKGMGDPVNMATGAFTIAEADLALPGIGLPFELRRTYTSADDRVGALGRGWTHNFATSLEILANGNVVLHGGEGQQVVYHEDSGTFTSDAGGRSTLTLSGGTYTLGTHDSRRYTFNSSGQMTALADRNGNDLSFTYNSGKLTGITDTVGRSITISYNGSGLLSAVTLPDGRDVGYGYTNGLLTSVTDVRDNTITYGYDAAGRLDEWFDQNGHRVVLNVYDSTGRVIQQTDARGKNSFFGWDPGSETATFTDARGKEWKQVYNSNILVKEVDPLGNTTTYFHDADLNVAAVTDARNHTTSMTYDAAGNMVTRTAPSPLSYVEVWTYTPRNDVDTYENGRDQVTDYGYDSGGNLTTVTRPGSIVTSYGRDPAGTGLLFSVTDPRNKTTSFGYDADGNLDSVQTPTGSHSTMHYDSGGRMDYLVEARGNETGATPTDYDWLFTYDAANHLRTRTDPLGNAEEWTYDPAGNLDTFKNQKARIIDYGYDNAGNLTTVTAPDLSVTSYAYDDANNLTARVDAETHRTEWTYDDAGRLASELSPIGQAWTYAYDANSNVKKVVDANGNATGTVGDGTTLYAYDDLDRLTGIDYSDSTPDVAYGYDANSNRIEMTDGQGTETYVYDSLDRLQTITRGTAVLDYDYDDASNVTKRTYPDSTVVDYTFDDDSRLETVSTAGKTTAYGYDSASNLQTTTLPSANGHVETRFYDRAARLTEIRNQKAGSTLSSATYVLDAGGNPRSKTTTTATETYLYDELDRLTEVCFQAASCSGALDPHIRYGYDDVGNRLTETTPTGTTTYTYNAADQLTHSVDALATTNYTYDDNGNQITAGNKSYSYGMDGLMKAATLPVSEVAYAYDGDGKRLEAIRTAAGVETARTGYLWDPNFALPQLVTERTGSGALIRRYVHGHDLISATDGTTDSYFHHDGLGSVVNVTNGSGAEQWRYDYEPFGELRSETQLDPTAAPNLMRFTGELWDPETELYHLRARQYDASLGIFTAMDPVTPSIADPAVSNFSYVGGRPTVHVDPSGEVAVLVVGVVVVVVVVGGTGLVVDSYVRSQHGADEPKTEAESPSYYDNGAGKCWGVGSQLGPPKDNYVFSKGRGRIRDSGLQNVPDDEISRRARDPNLPKAERRRYKREEKARGLRRTRRR